MLTGIIIITEGRKMSNIKIQTNLTEVLNLKFDSERKNKYFEEKV